MLKAVTEAGQGFNKLNYKDFNNTVHNEPLKNISLL